jgi:hypothetical protein
MANLTQGRRQRAKTGPGLFEHEAVSVSPFLLIETAPCGHVTDASVSPAPQAKLQLDPALQLSCFTFIALRTLWTRRSFIGLSALRAGRSLLTLRSRGAGRARRSLITLCALRSRRTLIALGSLLTLPASAEEQGEREKYNRS